ncbi:unnamed protein product [Notodromas monacha]|uniref:RRM domain-containing protein n=1 Tax=Notodromas monacha TaxID=399045 RepID=A0A7R9GCY1_9CRUS|nr:unnamed protein product [Notodromas monacha]CAG0916576.1 unnamed protein product [Notodromas monacha]
MASKMEMSLEDIIAQSKKSGGMPRGRGRGAGRDAGGRRGATGGPFRRRGAGSRTGAPYARGNVESRWEHDLFDGGNRAKLTQRNSDLGASGKLLVSNLDFGVSDKDMKELFAEFGPLEKAQVHYDRSGRSLGTADIVFVRRNDAVRAMRQYNGVPLDGRAMDIQLTASADEVVTAKSRIGPIRGRGLGRAVGGRGRGGAVRGRRGAPRGGGGGGRGGRKEQLSVDELNKQLDEYLSQK